MLRFRFIVINLDCSLTLSEDDFVNLFLVLNFLFGPRSVVASGSDVAQDSFVAFITLIAGGLSLLA